MHAKLISHSQPTGRIHSGELAPTGLDNIQDLIAYAARVSNPSNQANTKTTGKLLDYLIKHKHWSPFEMASACIEIETTRDIARQLLRHRSFSFQEFSQRYADIRDLDDSLDPVTVLYELQQSHQDHGCQHTAEKTLGMRMICDGAIVLRCLWLFRSRCRPMPFRMVTSACA